MKIVLRNSLTFFFATALLTAPAFSAAQPAGQSSATNAAPAAAADASLTPLLAQVRSTAQKSDMDIGRLQINKWKTDSGSKRQAQASADSIQRNLTAAVPDLLEQIRSNPNSMVANFRLYRDLNALYDTFSALAESAGAFGPTEQYSALAADLTQLDQARQRFADRVDLLAGTHEAELARLRARPAVAPSAQAPAKPTKIVVDDNAPAHKSKPKRKTTAKTAKP